MRHLIDLSLNHMSPNGRGLYAAGKTAFTLAFLVTNRLRTTGYILRRWVAATKSPDAEDAVRVDIDALAPGITRLRLTGRLDMACAPAFRRTLQAVIQYAPKGLIVSFAELGCIDSSGIAVLIEGLRWSHQRGITFTLTHLTPEVQMALELARLENLFAIARPDDADSDPAGLRSAL